MSGFIIGIDPDLVKSGVAITKDKKILELHAMSFPELLGFAELYKESTFILEDVNFDKPTYIRPGTTPKVMRKISQDVGKVKGTAYQLFECLEHMGCNIKKIKPLRGPVKKRAKKDGEYFNKTFGWSGRTNEDKRDAALLALSV